MSSDKIKVAVRLRPFNRRGKLYINSSINFTQLQNLRLWCVESCVVDASSKIHESP